LRPESVRIEELECCEELERTNNGEPEDPEELLEVKQLGALDWLETLKYTSIRKT
jgi:hypothetical protein